MSKLIKKVQNLKKELVGCTINDVRIVTFNENQMVDSYDDGQFVCFDVTTKNGKKRTFSIANSAHPYAESTLSNYLLGFDETDIHVANSTNKDEYL